MRATASSPAASCSAADRCAITDDDLNTESISLLVEINDFDFLVSGDLTGGGSTSTAKTPDVETYVGQLAGDVDVVQLNHHGSTTTSNQMFLAAVKAEVAVAQVGDDNTFGHPNREIVNKLPEYAVTSGNTFARHRRAAAGQRPGLLSDRREPGAATIASRGRAYTGADAAHAGQGTSCSRPTARPAIRCRASTTAACASTPALHTYAIDGVSAGVTTNFPPTVDRRRPPVVPLATEQSTCHRHRQRSRIGDHRRRR